NEVHRDEKEEEKTHYPGKLIRKRLNVDPSGGHVDGGQDGDGERSEEETDRIQKADLQAPESGSNQHSDQEVIFECKQLPVAVALDSLIDFAIMKQPADEVMEGTIGAHPVAEEPSQKQGGNYDSQGQHQTLVEGMCRHRRRDGHQRVYLEKQGNRISFEVTELCDESKEQRESYKEDL